jgi:GT2 family glycosyltransferase/glycosyltransferase involved in cell wall biosynthesis
MLIQRAIMTPPKKPLQIYAYGDFLVLYWQRTEKLAGEIRLLLDGEPLEKPLLGVEFKERPDYVLAAFAKALEGKRNFTIRIVSADSQLVAEAKCRKIQPLPRKLVSTWSLASRVRVEKALIAQAGQVFPQLRADAKAEVAASLAESETTAIQGPDGLLYIRMPWPASAEPALMDATLRTFPGGRSEDFSESVKALLEGDNLHFFSREAMAHWAPDRVWMLDAGKMRCAPFLIQQTETLASGVPVSEWLDAISATYPANPAVLRGFAAAVLDPPRRRAVDQRKTGSLLGKAEAIRSGKIVGWAFDPRRPHTPAHLKVVVDGQDLGEIEAHLPRKDLESHGYGNCGFVWQPEEGLMSGEPHEIRFRSAETGEELPGSPFRIGRGEYDSEFHLDEEGYVSGWIKERCAMPQPRRVGVLVDGEHHAEVLVNPYPGKTEPADSGIYEAGRLSFRVFLPDRVFDTETHIIEVEVKDTDKDIRLDQKLPLRADYRSSIDVLGPERVIGAVINTIAPKRPVVLDLLVNGIPVVRGRADQARPDVATDSRCGFDLRVPPPDYECGSLSLELCLAGTGVRILGPGVLHTPYDIAVRSLTTLAEILNDASRLKKLAGGLRFDEDVSTWVRTQIIAKLLVELRREKSIPSQVELSLSSTIKLPHRERRESIVDVIIPVYMGRDAVLRCISSVLCARCQVPMELIVVDDASPDPELNAELRRLASMDRCTFLENRTNLGFVGTANRGMRLHPGRDVVLLNSDTVVADGWLDRLYRAAYEAPNIGTVTPFSNNATICSFPHFCQPNPIPDGLSSQRLDTLFAEANAGQTVDLPTAVGFCMFIKRDLMEEIGFFDEGQWGKGYGEENDFCLRASTLGWRHVAACDVFVEHEGGVSFADGKSEQLGRNLEKLNAIYPDYAATIQRFIAQDPLAPARSRVARMLLKEHAPRYMLFVMHGLGGGAKIAADELAAHLAREGMPVLELMSMAPGRWKLACYDLPHAIHYRHEDFEELVKDLRDLGVWHIHYHQTMHFPKQIWELPALLKVAYDFTVHDYLALCPRINMIDESGYYCGETQFSSDSCTRCIRLNGLGNNLGAKYLEFGNHVGHWRAVYADVLQKARRVFAPSEDAAQRLQAHFRLPNLKVVPHLEQRSEIRPVVREGNAYTVAVIGAIGQHKGQDILLRCVHSAEKEGLPLRFAIIGFTADDQAFSRYSNVTISGAYRREDLPRLIEASQAGVALFLSPWPETYCFALSEAWQNGLYPVALDIGAIAERIRQAKCGRLIPLTADPRQINRILMEVLDNGGIAWNTPTIAWEVANTLRDYYELTAEVADAGGNVSASATLPAMRREKVSSSRC